MPRRKNKKRKEEYCEGYCFSCKDGGQLLICDYKDCLKAYHLECVEKDESFLESEERWSCASHSCFLCDKSSKFRCLCCPLAVCGRCIQDSEFVPIKANKGFCQNCLKLALLLEEGLPADSEEVSVDFNDNKSSEFFFSGYWEYIKKEEGLNRECLRAANDLLKEKHKYRSDPYFLDIEKIDGNGGDSEEDSHYLVSDYDELEEPVEFKPDRKRRRFKRNSCGVNPKKAGRRRREKSTKNKFVGWVSKSLLEFLDSVGKDTSTEMGEYEVVSVVMKYCVNNKLFDPLKKKRIICDDALRSLFKMKFVLKNSLNKLVSVHFASNCEQSTGNGSLSSSSDEEKEDANMNVDLIGTQKLSGSPRKTQKVKVNPDVQKSCYALVNSENIKLVYLKRSFLEELLKKPAEFFEKVVGSFVRVKCNPNDYLQKNSHQLLQVKGVTASNSGQILLQFFDCPEDFPVSKLSNDNFTEEECEDLRDRIKDGLLKKPTVVELEHKARSLHKDMINHWIPKEMEFLQRRIDQANEKGWRRELSQYVDRLQLLGEESERQRLLNDLPKIIAEPVVVIQDFEKYDSPVRSASPSFLDSDYGSGNFSHQSAAEVEDNQYVTSSANGKALQECNFLEPEIGDNDPEDDKISETKDENNHSAIEKLPQECHVVESEVGDSENLETSAIRCKMPCYEETLQKHNDSTLPELQSSSSSAIDGGNTNQLLGQQATVVEYQSNSMVEVIELSDSEPEVDTKLNPVKDLSSGDTRDSRLKEIPERTDRSGNRSHVDVNASQWYCRTARGYRAGPFKMSTLKKGFETRDHKVEMWVWMKGGNEDDAILLDDAIHRLFPGT